MLKKTPSLQGRKLKEISVVALMKQLKFYTVIIV